MSHPGPFHQNSFRRFVARKLLEFRSTSTISRGEQDPTLRALVSLAAEDIEEYLVKLLHSDYIKFLDSLE